MTKSNNKYNIVLYPYSIVFDITWDRQYKYWYAKYAEIEITDNNRLFNFTMDPTDFDPPSLYTPLGLSYHCSSLTIHEQPTSNSSDKVVRDYENKVKLDIYDFQVCILSAI